MKSLIKINFFIIAFLLFLGGCTESRYKSPCYKMPEKYDHIISCQSVNQNQIAHWWYKFQDDTLNALIAQAIKENYQIKQAVERIEEARARYNFSRASLFPEIDVVNELRHTQFSNVLEQASYIPGQKVSFLRFGIDCFWEMDFWGKIWHKKNADFFTVQSEIYLMRDILIMVLAEVARTYINFSALYSKKKLIFELIKTQEALICLDVDRFQSGIVSQLPVLEEQQFLAQQNEQLKDVTLQFQQTQNALAVLLGKNPEEFSVDPACDVPQFANTLESIGIPSDLLRNRPDIRKAERLLAAAFELREQAVAEWFPSFALLGGVGTEASRAYQWFGKGTLAWFIAQSIKWPLINFGRIRAKINEREAIKKQACYAYSETIITALKEVENFLIAYFQTTEKRTFAISRVEILRRQEQLIFDQYQAGTTNKQELLQIQKQRLITEIELIEVKQELSNALVGLYKALGGGS